jgi:hypothetical protein
VYSFTAKSPQQRSPYFAAQVFSTTQAFVRYSMLTYLSEHEPSHRSIGEMFHEIEQEAATVTYLNVSGLTPP